MVCARRTAASMADWDIGRFGVFVPKDHEAADRTIRFFVGLRDAARSWLPGLRPVAYAYIIV